MSRLPSSSSQFHAQVWQREIERVSGAQREVGVGTCLVGLKGLLTVCARDLVAHLVAVGRCKSRVECVALCEALRARDIIRPSKGEGEIRFTDGGSKWVCRADEAPTPETSFSVPAIMNRSEYILAAPMFKQGTLFLNPRFFLLDRAECRLYVFNTDYALLPRYYVDFRRQACVVTPIAPPSEGANGGQEALGMDYSTDDSDTEEEGGEEGGVTATPSPSTVRPWLPTGTGSTSLPAGKAGSWGFTISGPGNLKVQAYAATKRRALVWCRALSAAAACKPSRLVRSHSQVRLVRLAPVKSTNNASTPMDGSQLLSALAAEGGGGGGGGAQFPPLSPAGFEVPSFSVVTPGGGGGGSGAMTPAHAFPASAANTAAGAAAPTSPLKLSLSNVNPSALPNDGGASDEPAFTPTTIRQLLAIPQSHVRRVLPPSWGYNFARLRHEALVEEGGGSSSSTGGGVPFASNPPSWVAVEEDDLWGQLCKPETLRDLYAWPLELYTSCLSASIARVNQEEMRGRRGRGGEGGEEGGGGGEEEEEDSFMGAVDDAVGVGPPPPTPSAFRGSNDLRPLRYFLFDPSRCARDLGIFIPAHVRAILERIAAFVPPLPIELEAEEGEGEGVEDGGGSPLPPLPSSLHPPPSPPTTSAAPVAKAAEVSQGKSHQTLSRAPSIQFSSPTLLARSTSRVFKSEFSSAHLNSAAHNTGATAPSSSSTSPLGHHLNQQQQQQSSSPLPSNSSAIASALEAALGKNWNVSGGSGGGGGGGVGGVGLEESTLPPKASSSPATRGFSRSFASPSRKASMSRPSFSHPSRSPSFALEGGRVRAPSSGSPTGRGVSFSLPRGTSSHSIGLHVSLLPRDTPSFQTNRRLAQNTVAQAFGEYRRLEEVAAATASGGVKGGSSSSRGGGGGGGGRGTSSERSSPDLYLLSSLAKGSEKLVMLGGALASGRILEKGEEERLAAALLPKAPTTVGDGTRALHLSVDGGVLGEEEEEEEEDVTIEAYGEMDDLDTTPIPTTTTTTTTTAIPSSFSTPMATTPPDRASPPELPLDPSVTSPPSTAPAAPPSSHPLTHETALLSHENAPWEKLGSPTCQAWALEISRTATHVHSLFSFSRLCTLTGSSDPSTRPTVPLGSASVSPEEWGAFEEALKVWGKEKSDTMAVARRRGDSLEGELSYGLAGGGSGYGEEEGEGGGGGGFGSVAASSGSSSSSSTVAALLRGASRINLDIPAPTSSGEALTGVHAVATAEAAAAAAAPSAPPFLLPLDPPLLRKTMELCLARVKSIMVAQVTAILTSGRHPLSILLQRCMSALAAVYGHETFPYWGVSEEGGSEALKFDLKGVLKKVANSAKRWPRVWLEELEEWGSTAGALNPTPTFTQCLGVPSTPGCEVVSGLTGVFFSTASCSTHAAVVGGLAAAPPPTLTPHHRNCWRLVCKLAKSLFLTDRDVDDIVTEAVARAVLEKGGFVGIIGGFYRVMHGEADAMMGVRQRVLWGLTTTQLDLSEELRVDACAKNLMLPVLPTTTSSSSPPSSSTTSSSKATTSPPLGAESVVQTSPIFSPIVSSTIIACAVLPVGLPLPHLDTALLPYFQAYRGEAAAAGPTSPLLHPYTTHLSPWPLYSAGTHTRPAAIAALQPALDVFSLLPHLPEPSRQFAVLLATVDILCRCVTTHRSCVAEGMVAVAEAQAQAQAVSGGAQVLPPPPTLPEPAHINADDLLGLLCYTAIHCGAPHLHSTVASLADYAGEESLIEKPGFFLTSLQAGLQYAISPDILLRLKCGHCEGPSTTPFVVCTPCGRQLCSQCDTIIHGSGGGGGGGGSCSGGGEMASHDRQRCAARERGRSGERGGGGSIVSGGSGGGGGGGRLSEPTTTLPPMSPSSEEDTQEGEGDGFSLVAAAAHSLLVPGASRYTLGEGEQGESGGDVEEAAGLEEEEEEGVEEAAYGL